MWLYEVQKVHQYEVKGPQFFVVIKPWFDNQWMRPKLHKFGSGIRHSHQYGTQLSVWSQYLATGVFVFRVEWKSSRRAVLSRPTSVFTSTWCGSQDQSRVSSTGNVHSNISCFSPCLCSCRIQMFTRGSDLASGVGSGDSRAPVCLEKTVKTRWEKTGGFFQIHEDRPLHQKLLV